MKKVILKTTLALLIIAGIPLSAKAVDFRVLDSLLHPCNSVYDHLDQTSRSCPEGAACIQFPALALETVSVPSLADPTKTVKRCRMRTLDQENRPEGVEPNANFIGINHDGTEDDLGFVWTSGNIFFGNFAIDYTSLVIDSISRFKNYDYFEYFGLRMYFPEIHIMDQSPHAGGPAVPVTPIAIGDDVRAALERAEAHEAAGPSIPGFIVSEEEAQKIGEVLADAQGGESNVQIPAGVLNVPQEFANRLKVAADQSEGAGSPDGTPIADLELTEVNPTADSLCSLQTNAAPTMASLAYIGFGILGVVLAKIRRRIRSRSDR